MFFTIDDHNIHVALHGNENAPALVLLHSLGTSHEVWQKQVRHFSLSHFVICPDFRGHGLSELSHSPVTIETLAKDIIAILATLDVGAIHLSGISIGGLVAQCVAATLHDKVRSLTLFDSNIVSLAPQMWRERAAKVRADGLPSIANAVLARWVTSQCRDRADIRGLTTMLARTTSEGYAAGCEALAIADCRPYADSLTMPVLVAVGEQDEATPPSAAQALADMIVGSRFHIIPDAAHIPLLEQAEAVNTLIRQSIDHNNRKYQ
jgi:3-oxoadipate enol-lactonase